MIVFSVLNNVYMFFQYSIQYLESNLEQLHLFKSGSYRLETIDDYKENFSTHRLLSFEYSSIY